MDNRDLLYNNRFVVENPSLQSINRQENYLRQINRRNQQDSRRTSQHLVTQNPHLTHRLVRNQSQPRSMFSSQLEVSKDHRGSKKLKRTTVTIDSQNRQKITTFTKRELFFGIQTVFKEIEILLDNENIKCDITFEVTAENLNDLESIQEELNATIRFYLQNVPSYPQKYEVLPTDVFYGIPLRFLNYDSDLAAPFHSINQSSYSLEYNGSTVSSLNELKSLISVFPDSFNLKLSFYPEGLQNLKTTSFIDLSNPPSIYPRPSDNLTTSLEFVRIENIVPGFRYPNKYSINLGATFNNVIAVRLLNSIIPNIAYMINSTNRVGETDHINNKIKWINESSLVRKPNASLYTARTFLNKIGISSLAELDTSRYTVEDVLDENGYHMKLYRDTDDGEVKIALFAAIQYAPYNIPQEHPSYAHLFTINAIQSGTSDWKYNMVLVKDQEQASVYRDSSADEPILFMFPIIDENTYSFEIPLVGTISLSPEEGSFVQMPSILSEHGFQVSSFYFQHTISIQGGNYDGRLLADELSKELNAELVSSNAYDELFNSFNWKLNQFEGNSEADHLFRTSQQTVPLQGKFNVTVDEKKKLLSISQYRTIYYNTGRSISEDGTEIEINYPFVVNAGFPYLYIKNNGTELISGDTIKIENSENIFNIKSDQINREHRIVISKVWLYVVSVQRPKQVGVDTTCPFLMYEIVVDENDRTNLGRVVGIESEYSSGSFIIKGVGDFLLRIEMFKNAPFSDSTTIIGMTSNAKATFLPAGGSWFGLTTVPSETFYGETFPILLPNAYTGYSIKLSTVPTSTNLVGVGNEKIFIGELLSFRLLLGMPETPKKALGFVNSNAGQESNDEIIFQTHESNTIEVDRFDIDYVEILSSTPEQSHVNCILHLKTTCNYTSGDRVFIRNFQPLQHLHSHEEKETMEIVEVRNNGGNIRLVLNSNIPEIKTPFGNIPENFNYMVVPIKVDDYIFVYNHKKIIQKDGLSSLEYQNVGLEDQVLKVSGILYDGTHILIDTNQPWNSTKSKIHFEKDSSGVDLFTLSIKHKGQTRVSLPDVQLTNGSFDATTNIFTLSYVNGSGTPYDLFNRFDEYLIYVYNESDNLGRDSGHYFKTVPQTSSVVAGGLTRTLQVKVDEDFTAVTSTSITNWRIRKCNSRKPYHSVLNSPVGFIIQDVTGDSLQVRLNLPKEVLKLNLPTADSLETAGVILRAQMLGINQDNQAFYGNFGTTFMKEIDSPYTTQEEFIYLKCPTLSAVHTSALSPLSNVFAKFMLPGESDGHYVFDTFVSAPKIFNDFPLRELRSLDFEFVKSNGETFVMNELEHSLMIEVIEKVERLDNINVQMR